MPTDQMIPETPDAYADQAQARANAAPQWVLPTPPDRYERALRWADAKRKRDAVVAGVPEEISAETDR